MKTDVYLYLAQFFLDYEMFQAKFVAKVKTPILFSLNFAPKNVPFMMWKNIVQSDRP